MKYLYTVVSNNGLARYGPSGTRFVARGVLRSMMLQRVSGEVPGLEIAREAVDENGTSFGMMLRCAICKAWTPWMPEQTKDSRTCDKKSCFHRLLNRNRGVTA